MKQSLRRRAICRGYGQTLVFPEEVRKQGRSCAAH
jgi:hypothetical protein